MKQRRPRRAPLADDPASRLYRSGEAVPVGTYVSLDDNRLVHVSSGGTLPAADPFPRYFLRLYDSPDYTAPLSLLNVTEPSINR